MLKSILFALKLVTGAGLFLLMLLVIGGAISAISHPAVGAITMIFIVIACMHYAYINNII